MTGRIVLLTALLGIGLHAEWDKAYAYGDGLADPNKLMDYQKEFRRYADEGNIYDESQRNRMTPEMVEVEDRMTPVRSETDNYSSHTKNFFYSSNKRDYYTKEAKKYHRFPTTDY